MARTGASGPALRVHTARGTMVNAGFSIALQTLGLLKGFVVAAFLTRAEYGLWGVLVVVLGTLGWLKQVGISEKFVQQDADDQRLAFQRAFTLELLSDLALLAIGLAALPVYAAVTDRPDIVAPGLVLLATIPLLSLRMPTWIFYRDMRFARQRLLESVDPVVAFVVTIVLAVAGLGHWALVIGYTAGVVASGAAALAASPHPIALRFDRRIAREYVAFSWPLLVASASGLVIPQASVLVGEATLGIAGAGAIVLAGTIATYADRVDRIVSMTLYPAICRVQDRLELLHEAFVKSNRLTLMWAIPFGAGIALFAPHIVRFGLGERWEPAVGLMQLMAVAAAINHVGFNWASFFRARGDTRPLAVAAPLTLLAFLAMPLPLLIAFGLKGLGVGMVLMAAASLAIREHYLRRLFPGFRILPHALRAVAPTVPAVATVLAMRAAAPPDTVISAAAEAAAYVAVTVLATWGLERRLLQEAVGYLRGRLQPTPAGTPPRGAG